MKAIFRKYLNRLVPHGTGAEELLREWKDGDLMTVDVRKPRNLAHHAKFFALLQLIHENQDHYKSVDEILTVFKFHVGHTERIKTRHGIIEIPLSISFAKMDQTAFDGFYSKALDFVVSEVIPGLEKESLERELLEFAA